MKLLKMLAQGFESLLGGFASLTIDPEPMKMPKLPKVNTSGPEEDSRALAGDWANVGKDIRSAMDKAAQRLGPDGGPSERPSRQGDMGGVSCVTKEQS